jgi:hypothetical protein
MGRAPIMPWGLQWSQGATGGGAGGGGTVAEEREPRHGANGEPSFSAVSMIQ